jgi:hypothetical protein
MTSVAIIVLFTINILERKMNKGWLLMLEVSLEKSLGKFMLQSSFTANRGVLGILG